MAADEKGNDVQAVGVPVTGNLGIAPAGTPIPSPSEGGSRDFTLDPAFKVPGLLKEDGGPEWTMEADGDPITFWQEGYSIPSGLANATVAVGFAQTDETVRSIIRGKTADANGYITIDAGGHSLRYVLFTEEIFKNGVIRRRVAADAFVQSVAEDKSTRGEVLGYTTTFGIARSPLLNDEHLGEWLIPATSNTPAPAWQAETAYEMGALVTITGGAVLRAIGAGTSGTVAPTGPGEDGTVTWVAN